MTPVVKTMVPIHGHFYTQTQLTSQGMSLNVIRNAQVKKEAFYDYKHASIAVDTGLHTYKQTVTIDTVDHNTTTPMCTHACIPIH